MPNSFFQFKQFRVEQELAAMKVTTDACLFGAWVGADLYDTFPHVERILDIGTGTGLLSLMVAQKTDAHIDAIEIDPPAAMQATHNFSASPWSERMNVIKDDVRGISITKPYNVIISNPPFYEHDLQGAGRQKNLAHHGEGLLLNELVKAINQLTAQDGVFYLLLPPKRLPEFNRLCEDAGFQVHALCQVKQSVSHGVFRVMIKGGRTSLPLRETTIAIRDAQHNYTSDFIHYLRSYYLHL